MLYPLTFTLWIVPILLQPKIQLPMSRLLGLDKLSHCGRQVLTNICFHNYLLFTNICFRKLCSLFELFSFRGYLIRNCSRQVGEIQVAMLNNFVLLIKINGLILNQAKYKKGCHYWGQEKVWITMYTSSNPGYGSIKNFTLLFSDLLLLPLFVQQWPGDEKSQCWPWYLSRPHIIAVINITFCYK